jgi:3-methyl-2-oxobutanoate hydroxymethyltransferase
MQDALGLTVGHTPKFAFNVLKETGNVIDAVKLYISKVESGEYPTAEQSFA